LPGSHKQKRPDQPLKQVKQRRKKPNTRLVHNNTSTAPKRAFERQYLYILYITRIKISPLMNFLKLLILLKRNLILQIYKHETAKQKIRNSRAEFPMKIYHVVFRNSV